MSTKTRRREAGGQIHEPEQTDLSAATGVTHRLHGCVFHGFNKIPVVNSFQIAGKMANRFHAPNESQPHDSISRFEGQSAKGSAPP